MDIQLQITGCMGRYKWSLEQLLPDVFSLVVKGDNGVEYELVKLPKNVIFQQDLTPDIYTIFRESVSSLIHKCEEKRAKNPV